MCVEQMCDILFLFDDEEQKQPDEGVELLRNGGSIFFFLKICAIVSLQTARNRLAEYDRLLSFAQTL